MIFIQAGQVNFNNQNPVNIVISQKELDIMKKQIEELQQNLCEFLKQYSNDKEQINKNFKALDFR